MPKKFQQEGASEDETQKVEGPQELPYDPDQNLEERRAIRKGYRQLQEDGILFTVFMKIASSNLSLQNLYRILAKLVSMPSRKRLK